MQDLELRGKVAIACGWADVSLTRPPFEKELVGWSPYFDFICKVSIPEYELSLDAIVAEFDKKDWNFQLIRSIESDGMTIYSAKDSRFSLEIENMPTGAIALCKLFLAINEQEKK
jgi:hypothetical protein